MGEKETTDLLSTESFTEIEAQHENSSVPVVKYDSISKTGLNGQNSSINDVEYCENRNENNDEVESLGNGGQQDRDSDEKEGLMNGNGGETHSTKSPKSLFSGIQRRFLGDFQSICSWNSEIESILKYAVPYTVSEVARCVFDVVIYGLVGNYLGLDALSAFAIIDVLLSLSNDILYGTIEASNVLVPQSLGTHNFRLSGQYVQISLLLYMVLSLPVAVVWWLYSRDVVLWFGFSESVAELSVPFARIRSIGIIVAGARSTVHLLLEMTGRINFSTNVVIGCGLVKILGMFGYIFCGTHIYDENAIMELNTQNSGIDLKGVAAIDLGVELCFLALMYTFVLRMGWIDEYLEGLFGTWAMITNPEAVQTLVSNALPLAVESLFVNGEWQMFTFLAAHDGPTSVAAWAVAGTLWEAFEASSVGFGEAAEIRVGQYLGRGKPDDAQKASYQVICLGTSVALVGSLFLLLVDAATSSGGGLPGCLTSDPFLQRAVGELLPYIAVGNVAVTYGVMCWSILAGQGRLALATTTFVMVASTCTVPLGAVLTFVFDLGLRGLAMSMVIGYLVVCIFMNIHLKRSNWDQLSKSIQETMGVSGEIEPNEYEDLYWHELPPDVKEAASFLGYNNDLWNYGGSIDIEDYDWSELSRRQKKALTKLGYNKESWEKS